VEAEDVDEQTPPKHLETQKQRSLKGGEDASAMVAQ
jgi:hypothetical protein